MISIAEVISCFHAFFFFNLNRVFLFFCFSSPSVCLEMIAITRKWWVPHFHAQITTLCSQSLLFFKLLVIVVSYLGGSAVMPFSDMFNYVHC